MTLLWGYHLLVIFIPVQPINYEVTAYIQQIYEWLLNVQIIWILSMRMMRATFHGWLVSNFILSLLICLYISLWQVDKICVFVSM